MADIRIVAENIGFPEGPVAMPDGSVIVCDIRKNCVSRVAVDGTISLVAATGGGPNGLAVGPDGALYACNNGGNLYVAGNFMGVGPSPDYDGGSIQRIDIATGAVTTLYTHCGQHKLAAPNDIVFDRQGGFYFTDLGKRRARDRTHGGLYYARPDGTSITELAYPILSPNGVGLSPDERIVYVADTETSRLLAYDIVSPGVISTLPYPSAFGSRVVCGLPGFQRFDSLALEAGGNICVATLMTGHITVISPAGEVVRQVKVPETFPTNLCFGGPDMRTAYITLSETGRLGAMTWQEPGLRLNFSGL